MYYMIYATDHPEAPTQMSRASRNTVLPLEPAEQLKFWPDARGPESEGGEMPTQPAQRSAQRDR